MKRGWLLKISLLSASLLVASPPAINANIPAMAEAFFHIPLSMIEMLSTISSMFLMISVLTSSFIAKKIGYKETIVLGLVISMISGVIPAFVDDFYIILISSAMLGFGIGLFNSLLVTMISCFYDGDERSSLFGKQSAFEGLGGIFITFLAGQLLKINWQVSFYAYLIAVPVVILFVLFVPKVRTDDVIEIVQSGEEKEKIGSYLPVIGYTLIIFIISVLYMTMGIKVSTLMTSQGYATGSDASIVIVFLGIGSMVSGAMFGHILKMLKKYTLTLGFIIMAISMFLIGYANSTFLVIMSGYLIGFAFRNIFPYFIHQIDALSITNHSLAMSIFLAGSNLGSFLSPYGAIILQNLAGNDNLRGLFYVDGMCFLILAAGSIIFPLFVHKTFTNKVKEE